VLELAFQPDRSHPEPLYLQLADYLRGLALSGRLPAGEKLPPSRDLASGLGLSRNTVNQAYQCLIEDGVLAAHVGQGTFVASRGREAGARLRSESELHWPSLLAPSARRLRVPDALLRPGPARVRFEFRGGRIDAATLPASVLARAWSRALRRALPAAANAHEPLGYRPLREQIARALVARGISCAADEVVITSGAQQALDFVARVMLEPGDAVALEQPGYFGASICFRRAGAELFGIGVDELGLRTDELARLLRARRVKFVYVTPSAQFPTGAVLDPARRAALLELAADYQLPIVEDDYDSELRYGDPPLPALKTGDAGGRVIYVGTLSKALFPGLRLGYAVAPRAFLLPFAIARFAANFGADVVSQAAAAELLESGALERHVRRVRPHYAARRIAMQSALEAELPGEVRWRTPLGGHGFWLELPSALDPARLQAEAEERGIAYTRGDAFYADGRGQHALALSFTCESPSVIREGIGELAALIGRQLR
jgi:GntR family transcriptional regulator/MocR family aminotransferase